MIRHVVAVLLATILVAGCLGPGPELETEPEVQVVDLAPPEWRSDRIHMEVAVPVMLIGFDEAAANALAAELHDLAVDQWASTLNQPLPPDLDEGLDGLIPLDGAYVRMPILPTAVYDVTRLDEDFTQRFNDARGDWAAPGGALDGALFEAWLAEALAADGITLDPAAPALVLVATGGTWRYTFPHGHLEPVVSFGEREPMHIRIVADASANDMANLADELRELTRYRHLQGSVYPMPIAECHAITLITAYRPTSLGELLPELESAVDLIDVDELSAAFSNLTGTTVHVDSKVLELPLDDPILDVISRGEFGTMEVQRAWFTLNWEDYWVAHEGCEAYLSFVLHADLASAPTPVLGIGTYDGKRYRIAMSWVNDLFRLLLLDPASPVGPDDDSYVYNYINYLHAHEAGHILGMHHPFHLIADENGEPVVRSNQAFQDVHSVMSYSTSGRVIDFSAIDQANFQRNRAAFLIQEAEGLGLAGSPAWEAAFAHLAAFEWNAASAALWPQVAAEIGSGGYGSEGAHFALLPRLGGHTHAPHAP